MKGKKSSVSSMLTGTGDRRPITDIVFACDAGMGSSAMGASVLRRKIQKAGFADVTVVNQAISNLDDTHDLIVTHTDLAERARQSTPSAIHISVDDFMSSPRYDEIVDLLDQANRSGTSTTSESGTNSAVPVSNSGDTGSGGVATAPAPAVAALALESIVLHGAATTRDGAIDEAGRLLVECGAVEESYVAAMHEREKSVATFMGNGLAIPHGTNEAKGAILRTGLSFVRYDAPVDWKGKPAEFVIGIAGAGKDHLALLNTIAKVFLKTEDVERLREAQTPEEVRDILVGH